MAKKNHECFKNIRRVVRSTGRKLYVCEWCMYELFWMYEVNANWKSNTNYAHAHTCDRTYSRKLYDSLIEFWESVKIMTTITSTKGTSTFLWSRYNSANLIWMCAWLVQQKQKQNVTNTHLYIGECVCMYCIHSLSTRNRNRVPIGWEWRQLTRDLLFNGCCMHVYVLLLVLVFNTHGIRTLLLTTVVKRIAR